MLRDTNRLTWSWNTANSASFDYSRKSCINVYFFCLVNRFQVTHQSRHIQGYRIFYRAISSPWLVQDVEATSEHSIILADLQSNVEYEVKIRPYFNELQGHDSLMVVLRLPEEGEKSLSVTPVT